MCAISAYWLADLLVYRAGGGTNELKGCFWIGFTSDKDRFPKEKSPASGLTPLDPRGIILLPEEGGNPGLWDTCARPGPF